MSGPKFSVLPEGCKDFAQFYKVVDQCVKDYYSPEPSSDSKKSGSRRMKCDFKKRLAQSNEVAKQGEQYKFRFLIHKSQNELRDVTLTSIRAINRISLSCDYRLRGVKVIPVAPDGNCAFGSLGYTRDGFIRDVLSRYGQADQRLNELIEAVVIDLLGPVPEGIVPNTWVAQNLQVWAERFNNSNLWGGEPHFRVISRLYNLRIHVFILPENGQGIADRFIPLPGPGHLINEVDPTHVHLIDDRMIAWVPLQPIGGDERAELVHFEGLELSGVDFDWSTHMDSPDGLRRRQAIANSINPSRIDAHEIHPHQTLAVAILTLMVNIILQQKQDITKK